jgi:alpha-ketoglutaric semialdehyde dehydrogenase
VLGLAGAALRRFCARGAVAARPQGAHHADPRHPPGLPGRRGRAGRHRRRDAAGAGRSRPTQGCAAQAALYACDAATFLANPALEEEIFGPASLLVRCRDIAQLHAIAEHLEGQLTATVHAVQADDDAGARAAADAGAQGGPRAVQRLPDRRRSVHAMVHGGPFPATSDSRTTSVGAGAIDRFLRPVSYQDLPAALLPEALRDANPLGLARVVDGTLRMP